ncbi:ankyrin repeat domain-containing protein [Pseudoduganella violaceinigra]|uniref:ankyrin repeat domain-containing protein n=1 Tax=Pseudoduganella violaceinigra TaxID=246602 RepID=UPI000487513B|nr:ankyrin repeat domain-containing protein [Pseudoduganella violaceinigra]
MTVPERGPDCIGDASDELTALVSRYAALDMFSGYTINAPDSPRLDGDTPFHMVAFDGDIEAAKIMLPYVADINASGDFGCSPLLYAVMKSKLFPFVVSRGR